MVCVCACVCACVCVCLCVCVCVCVCVCAMIVYSMSSICAHMYYCGLLLFSPRFVSARSGLLLASDVAARGLDISKIEHIIHYQVPKNPDVSS